MTFLVSVGLKPAVLTVAFPAVTLSPVTGVAFMNAVGPRQPSMVEMK